MANKLLADLSLKLSADIASLKKDVNDSRNQFNRMERNASTAFRGIGAAFAAAFTIDKVVDFGKNVIQSSQALGDEYDQIVGGMEAATNQFFTTIATGDFSNLIDNLNEAAKAGREYVQALDDIGDRTRAQELFDADSRKQIAALERVQRDETKTLEERIEAGEKIQRIIESSGRKAVALAEDELDALLSLAEAQTDLDRAFIEEFLRGQDNPIFRQYQKNANELIAAQDELKRIELQLRQGSPQGTFQDSIIDDRDRLRKVVESATRAELEFADKIRDTNKLMDDDSLVSRKSLTDAFVKVTETEIRVEEEKNRVFIRNTRLQDEYNRKKEEGVIITVEQNKQNEKAIALANALKREDYLKKAIWSPRNQENLNLMNQELDALESLITTLNQELDAPIPYIDSFVDLTSALKDSNEELEKFLNKMKKPESRGDVGVGDAEGVNLFPDGEPLPEESDYSELDRIKEKLENQKEIANQLSGVWTLVGDSISDALQGSEDAFEDFGKAFSRLITSMIARLVALTAASTILSLLFPGLGSFSEIFNSLSGIKAFGKDSIFKRATGGSFDGLTLVGERGPELIAGSGYVYNARQTRDMIGGGNERLVAEVRGQDLAFILEKNSIRRNRI